MENPGLANGLNVYLGNITYQAVAEDLGYPYVTVMDALREELGDAGLSLAS